MLKIELKQVHVDQMIRFFRSFAHGALAAPVPVETTLRLNGEVPDPR